MDKNKPKRAPVKTDGPTLEETQADLLKLEILLAEASTWSHSTHDMYELRMKLVESSLSVTYWYINCDRSALSYSRRVAAWLQILLNNPPYYSTRQNIDFNLAPFAEPPFSNTPTAPTSNVPSNTPTAPTSNVPSNVSSNVPSNVPSNTPTAPTSSVPSNVPSNTPTAPTSNVPSNTQKMPGSRVVLESGVQGLVAALNASQGTGPAGVGNSGVGIPGEAGHGKSGGSGVGKGGAGDGGGLPMVRGSGVGKNGSAGQVAAVGSGVGRSGVGNGGGGAGAGLPSVGRSGVGNERVGGQVVTVGSGVGKSGVGNGGGGAGAGLPSVGRSGVGNERVGGQVGSVVSVLGKDGVQGEVQHRGLGNSGQGKGGLAAIGGLGAERKGVVGNVEAVGVGGSGVARREGGEVESAGVGGSGAKGEVGNDRSGGGGSKAGRGGIGRTLVTGGVGGGGVGGIAGTKDKGPEGEAEDDELPHPEGDEGWESQDEGESSGNDDGPRNGKKRKTPRSSEDEGQPEDYDTDGEPQRKRKKMNSRKSSKYHKDVVRGANGQILPDPGLGLRRFPRPCGRCARSKWLCLMSSTIEKACWNCARSKLQCAFSNGGAVDTGTEAESPGIRTSPKRSLKAIKKEFAEGTVHTVKSKMPRRKKKDGDSEKVAKGKGNGKGKGKEKSRAREADGEEEDEEIGVDEDVLEEKLPKGKGKGKGKARATEADDEEGDEGVEVDEDLVEEEEAQYRAAVKLSLQAKRRAEKQSREGPIASTSQIPPVPTTAVIAHPRVLQLAAPARRSRGRSTSSAETVKDPEDDSNAMDVDTDPSRDGSKTVKGKGRAAVRRVTPAYEGEVPSESLRAEVSRLVEGRAATASHLRDLDAALKVVNRDYNIITRDLENIAELRQQVESLDLGQRASGARVDGMESRLDQARHLEPRISAVEAKIVDQTIDGAVVQALLSRLGQLEHTTGALGSRLGEMERQLAEVLAQKRERDDELLEKLAALDESLKAASGGIAGRDHVQASIAEHEARIEASLDHRFGELAATIAASQANTLQLLESTHGPTRDDLFLPAQSFNHGREDFSGYDRRSGNGGLVRMDLMGSEIAGQRDGGLDRGQNLLAGSSHANEQWEGQDGGNVANRASGQSVTSQSVPMPISGYGMSASLAGQARGHPASGPQHGSYAAGDSASLAGHAHGHAASGPQHGSYAPSDWGADSTLSSVPSNVSSIGNPQSQRKPHGGPY